MFMLRSLFSPLVALALLCACGSDDAASTATGGAAGSSGSAGSAGSGASAGANTGGSGGLGSGGTAGVATGGAAGSGASAGSGGSSGAPFVDPTQGVSAVQKVAGGFNFTEGPVWMAATGKLLFTDIPNSRIHELTPPSTTVTVFREPSGQANGLGVDTQGLLIACEHAGRRVSRTAAGGQVSPLATTYTGKQLNSPNDVIVRSDGTIYFTDPPYGGNPNVLGFQGVFRIDPSQTLHLVSSDMFRPNGIALSPDEKTLYVTDSEQHYVRSHPVKNDGSTDPPKKLMDTSNGPDGMAVDDQGYLYITTSAGVEVYTPSGTLHDTLKVPEQPANCTFGGSDRKTLYITARKSLYSVVLNVPGKP